MPAEYINIKFVWGYDFAGWFITGEVKKIHVRDRKLNTSVFEELQIIAE